MKVTKEKKKFVITVNSEEFRKLLHAMGELSQGIGTWDTRLCGEMKTEMLNALNRTRVRQAARTLSNP
jgi:hypothetical protein